MARKLTNWENHKYFEDWENSLITKHFAFQFVNAYITLFSNAFADQDFNELALNLVIITVGKQIVMNLLDIYVPMLKIYWAKRKLNKVFITDFPGKSKTKEDIDLHYFVESQTILQTESNVLVVKYSEILIQLGYIVLFS